MNRTCRVGVHARNDAVFHDADYNIIREAKIETVKMMSHTHEDVFRRLKEVRSDIELITRLYDDRFGTHGHPSPEEFAARMIPYMKKLQPYSVKYEVHNEPNHLHRIEGWGDKDEDARDFNAWFLRVYDLIKSQCSWAQLGFPGLAIPHRDLEWVELCRPAVEKSDWLAVHCYWQTPPHEMHNHLADFWGLRFKYYYEKFPTKIIDLTEVGNSNVQNGIPFTRESHAKEFVEYLTECFKYPYLNSATFFIMSSPDSTWDGFCWRNESGEVYPITYAIRDMHRPHWTPAKKPAPVAAPAQPVTAPAQPAAKAATPAITVQAQQQTDEMEARLKQLRVENAQLKIQLRQLENQSRTLQSQLQKLQTSAPQPTVTSAVATQPAARVRAAPVRPAPMVQHISQQLMRNPTIQIPVRNLKQIDRIVIHHTAVPGTVGAPRIAEFLVQDRGRAGIAYHYFITAEGSIQQTNDLAAVTNQSSNPKINAVAVGVGFAGNFSQTVPAPAQIEAGAQLISWLLQQLKLAPQVVFGHKELVATQSPGAHWDSGAMWGAQLRQRIQALLAGAA